MKIIAGYEKNGMKSVGWGFSSISRPNNNNYSFTFETPILEDYNVLCTVFNEVGKQYQAIDVIKFEGGTGFTLFFYGAFSTTLNPKLVSCVVYREDLIVEDGKIVDEYYSVINGIEKHKSAGITSATISLSNVILNTSFNTNDYITIINPVNQASANLMTYHYQFSKTDNTITYGTIAGSTNQMTGVNSQFEYAQGFNMILVKKPLNIYDFSNEPYFTAIYNSTNNTVSQYNGSYIESTTVLRDGIVDIKFKDSFVYKNNMQIFLSSIEEQAIITSLNNDAFIANTSKHLYIHTVPHRIEWDVNNPASNPVKTNFSLSIINIGGF